MANWYSRVVNDLGEITNCISYYENELDMARGELSLTGKSVEKHSSEMPGIVEHRFRQLQEIEAILEHLNISLGKTKAYYFRKYLEHYNRSLSSKDAEKFAEGEEEVISMAQIVNEFAMLRNKYLALHKGLECKQFQLNNVVRLKVAGLDDAIIDK